MSNIVPNKETSGFEESRADKRKTVAMPAPETKSQDLGKIIFPSIKRAIAQNITPNERPITKSKPLDISTGIFVKGRQKIGNNITTRKTDRKENLSKLLEFILEIILQ